MKSLPVNIGDRFNRWTVISGTYKLDCYWKATVKCDCGVVKEVQLNSLKSGGSKSCGCYLGDVSIGDRFNRWTIISKSWTDKSSGRMVTAKCDCGAVKHIRLRSVKNSTSKSCGCFTVEQIKKSMTTHGQRKTKTYGIWAKMLQRCYNPNTKSYKNYGGRGITVCDRWRHSFENFLADMGEQPPRFTIERIDNEKGYSPENCRWASYKEQANNRRTNRFLTYQGRTQTMMEWSKELGIRAGRIRWRLEEGWSVEQVLETPNVNQPRLLTHNGKTQPLTDWAREKQMRDTTIRERLRRGWSVEDALGTPVRTIDSSK